MTSSVAMKLSGNLGERHRCFNALVREAHQQNTSLSAQHHPEEAALDRLFKIDLASKQRNVDFIIHTLKDDDLLYVNRALKSRWLLEPQYSYVINPGFLEDKLFPDMILPAVNRMRHWIQIYLRDQQRCYDFYQFYKDRNFDVAAKFLWHCSNEHILSEISDILGQITPKHLKRISEKVPQITRIYYESLKDNQTLLKYYLENDSSFFANLKYLLKTDADVFFYVLENFFVPQKFCTFNDATTKYIMKNHKSRFLLKPELYTAWFLHIDTLARHVSSEEIKELVLKLARSEYLQSWFSFQKVEPLIKRLSKDERVAFKNLVFVDKAFGSMVKEWPYPIPTPPTLTTPQTNLFEDTLKNPYYISRWCCESAMGFRCMLKKRKYCKWESKKTLLDQLFDKYRFYNFKKTLLELKKKLKAESSPQNREFMLLVLVSKTGGKTEDVIYLLDLLSHYKNEPVHIRAALVRSLVKRAFVWRLPSEHWASLLEWAHGLGLDGSTSEADCNEGLHAIVIRDLLSHVKPSQAVWEAFLTNCFDTLHGYSLNVDERNCVRARLPELLLDTVQSNPDQPQWTVIEYLLDTLEAYQIRFNDFPGLVDAVTAAVKCPTDGNIISSNAESLLRRLFNAGSARKRLIKEYFEIIQTNASYVNALRHDISILDNTEKLEKCIEGEQLNHDMFFRKLALFFTDKDGLAARYRAVLESRAATAPDKTLARPIALLSGSNFPSLLKGFDAALPKTPQRQLAAALKSNAHVVRPAFDLKSFEWRQAGAKAIANGVAMCRQRDVERYLQECLTWPRTLRLALMLAKRVNKVRDVFEVFAYKRPGAALKAALRYFGRERDSPDLRVWEMVKSSISIVDERQLRACVKLTKSVPAGIKAEYCLLVCLACRHNLPDLVCETLSEIPYILHELDQQNVFNAIDAFLHDYLTDSVKLKKSLDKNAEIISLYIEITAKFLVHSTSEEMVEERYRKVALPFLNRLQMLFKEISPDYAPAEQFLDTFLFFLRYNKAFFDVKCVSCLPVFERIIEWMHGFLPIEKWFDKYVTVHLTMIYFKAVRYCVERDPKLFTEPRKLEGAFMLGVVFGKFLNTEIEELTQRYFPTIIELYGSELGEYFSVYFRHSDKSIDKFKMGVLNGLLASRSVASRVLAKHMFMNFQNTMDTENVKEFSLKFNQSKIDVLRFEIDND